MRDLLEQTDRHLQWLNIPVKASVEKYVAECKRLILGLFETGEDGAGAVSSSKNFAQIRSSPSGIEKMEIPRKSRGRAANKNAAARSEPAPVPSHRSQNPNLATSRLEGDLDLAATDTQQSIKSVFFDRVEPPDSLLPLRRRVGRNFITAAAERAGAAPDEFVANVCGLDKIRQEAKVLYDSLYRTITAHFGDEFLAYRELWSPIEAVVKMGDDIIAGCVPRGLSALVDAGTGAEELAAAYFAGNRELLVTARRALAALGASPGDEVAAARAALGDLIDDIEKLALDRFDKAAEKAARQDIITSASLDIERSGSYISRHADQISEAVTALFDHLNRYPDAYAALTLTTTRRRYLQFMQAVAGRHWKQAADVLNKFLMVFPQGTRTFAQMRSQTGIEKIEIPRRPKTSAAAAANEQGLVLTQVEPIQPSTLPPLQFIAQESLIEIPRVIGATNIMRLHRIASEDFLRNCDANLLIKLLEEDMQAIQKMKSAYFPDQGVEALAAVAETWGAASPAKLEKAATIRESARQIMFLYDTAGIACREALAHLGRMRFWLANVRNLDIPKHRLALSLTDSPYRNEDWLLKHAFAEMPKVVASLQEARRASARLDKAIENASSNNDALGDFLTAQASMRTFAPPKIEKERVFDFIKRLYEMHFNAKRHAGGFFENYFIRRDGQLSRLQTDDLVELNEFVRRDSKMIEVLDSFRSNKSTIYAHFTSPDEPQIIGSLKCRKAIVEQLADPNGTLHLKLDTEEEVRAAVERANKRLSALSPEQLEAELDAPLRGMHSVKVTPDAAKYVDQPIGSEFYTVRRVMKDILGDYEGNWMVGGSRWVEKLFGVSVRDELRGILGKLKDLEKPFENGPPSDY